MTILGSGSGLRYRWYQPLAPYSAAIAATTARSAGSIDNPIAASPSPSTIPITAIRRQFTPAIRHARRSSGAGNLSALLDPFMTPVIGARLLISQERRWLA